MRLAHRLLALAQLVHCAAARLLRAGEIALQLLDARAQLLQLLGTGRAVGGGRESERDDRGKAREARGCHRAT